MTSRRAVFPFAGFLFLAANALTPLSPLRAQATIPAPTNDLPNPYRTITGWAKLGEGRTWGSTSAVDIDKDGKSIWVAERCGANSCAASTLPSIFKFDAGGNVVKSFGEGLIMAFTSTATATSG
jgi:hypothetical protein